MTEEDIVASWSERVRAATASNTPLRIRGGGTKDWYGQTLQGEIVDTRAHRGIIEYDPAELVITAKAGTPLSEIEAGWTNAARCCRSNRRTSGQTPRSAAVLQPDLPARGAPRPARRATSCSVPW